VDQAAPRIEQRPFPPPPERGPEAVTHPPPLQAGHATGAGNARTISAAITAARAAGTVRTLRPGSTVVILSCASSANTTAIAQTE
jgi:hypothetical protein